MELAGIHHVTAVTGHAAHNLSFYTEVLGMRLVKKTVNQDDLSAYHLFYGDAEGHPGTELTFFDWPDAGAARQGQGTISAIGLRVPGAALDYWLQRFDTVGVMHGEIAQRAGRRSLAFADPEGQRLQLVDDSSFAGTPWADSPVPPEMAVRGLGPITFTIGRADQTEHVLVDVMGFRPGAEYSDPEDLNPVRVYAVGPGGPGAEIHIKVRPAFAPGQVGIGGVHHVAFRTPDDTEHRAWRQRVADSGLSVTPVIDRFYFRALYFREPGGILCEISTDGPGFATDEDAAHLGERLALPPFLESQRAEIEAGLRPLPPVRRGAGIDVPAHVGGFGT
jgi:glyoxalase family protein